MAGPAALESQFARGLRRQTENLVGLVLRSWSARVALVVLLARIAYLAWPRKSLKGKNILITGGGGGLGREIAIQAAKAGANIVLWDISQQGMASVAADVEALGVKINYYQVDISKPEVVYEMAKKVQQEVGFIYCLINNAGIVTGKPLLESPDEAIMRTFKVNVLAHFWTVKAFLPAMIERDEGHICSIASAAGLLGSPKLTDYCSSKFAAVGFDESLRQELHVLGKNHIRNTIICPAHIATDLFKGYNPGLLQRSLTPQDVAIKTIEAIQRNKEVVLMPRMLYLAVLLKAILPTFLHDFSMLTTATGNAMNTFKGKRD